jgi:indole-3-glycerol phosphate synthase
MSTAARAQGGVLEEILASTRRDVETRREARPEGALMEAAAQRQDRRPGRLRDALRGTGMSVVAEFKRRSPSAGALREDADATTIAAAYERAGASAISVLTERAYFEGSLADLEAARAACELPLLRKDFIVDRYQLYEACAAGADAVLLIVAALDDAQLASLHDAAHALDLDPLVEVHSGAELRRALAVGAELIGMNNRDLRSFTVDLETTVALMPWMPAGATVVSESGIHDARDLRRLQQAGVHAVLIGEALMRAEDPEAALKALLGASEGAVGAG